MSTDKITDDSAWPEDYDGFAHDDSDIIDPLAALEARVAALERALAGVPVAPVSEDHRATAAVEDGA